MSVAEIRELMRLKGWNQKQLAEELDVTKGAITRWMNGEYPVTGPARKLMRIWLIQARDESAKQPA